MTTKRCPVVGEEGELHLAVGAQILVAETPGNLKITLHARDLEDLLKLLRRLRERVDMANW